MFVMYDNDQYFDSVYLKHMQSEMSNFRNEGKQISYQEGNQINHLIFLCDQYKKDIKKQTMFNLGSFLLSIFLSSYLIVVCQRISSLQEQNLIQHYRIMNINNVEYIKRRQLTQIAKNLNSSIFKLQSQIFEIKLQSMQYQNQIDNFVKSNRQEKSILVSTSEYLTQKLALTSIKYSQDLEQLKYFLESPPLVPKIIWLYTELDFQTENMFNQFQGNFILKKAEESGFQVKIVNSFSTYNWLSSETQNKITNAMQLRKINHSVHDILRAALLMQQGGIVFKVEETFFVEKNFDWLYNYLKFDSSFNGTSRKVLLFSEISDKLEKSEFQDFFMVAVKESSLAKDLFENLCEIIKTGELKFQKVKQSVKVNQDNGSISVKDLSKNILNSLISMMTLNYYSIEIIEVDTSLFQSSECRDQFSQILLKTDVDYKLYCGQPRYVIHLSEVERQKIEDELNAQLFNNRISANKNGYWFPWITAPGNNKFFFSLPERQISFCILDVHPNSDLEIIKRSLDKLKQQSSKQWTAVYFVEDLTSELQEYLTLENKNTGVRVKFVKHTGSLGRNYQVGIIKHCPNKSFVVILRRNQQFGDMMALEILTYTLEPREILGSFVDLSIKGKEIQIQTNFKQFSKIKQDGFKPQVQVLDKVLNHFRIFHSDCFKIIPQFLLRTSQGNYFNDRFVFLEQFLFMVKNQAKKNDQRPSKKIQWFFKLNSKSFDIPNQILLNKNIIIKTDKLEIINQTELKYNSFKGESHPLSLNFLHLAEKGIPFKQLILFNPGNQYQSYISRNKPNIVPKIIHIVHLEPNLRFIHQKIIQINQKLYPDYSFKIWNQENITQKNFPLTYNLLQTLIRIEAISKHSKKFALKYLMKLQSVYHSGGFGMQAGMILFNNVLDKWLSYKLILPSEVTYKHRWQHSMRFFGAVPKLPLLLRIIHHNHTNTFDIWSEKFEEQIISYSLWMRINQYDPDYLILSQDSFNPMSYSLQNHFDSYCWIQSSFLSYEDVILSKIDDRNLIGNCSKYYPYSFGKEIINLESSWIANKWSLKKNH